MVVQPPHHDVAALDQPQAACGQCIGDLVDEPRDPGTRGIHHGARKQGFARAVFCKKRGTPARALALECGAAGPGENAGATLARGDRVENDQPRIVHPGVRIDEAAAEPAFERRPRRMMTQVDTLRRRQPTAPREVVIEKEPGADQPRGSQV